MDMLEQVERQQAALVEQRHIVFLQIDQIGLLDEAAEVLQFGQNRRRDPPFSRDETANFGHGCLQPFVRVAEQRRQGFERGAHFGTSPGLWG